MKRILILLVGIFLIGMTPSQAQTTKEVKKVVIKKKVNKDGKVSVETIEAEGAEADALIKKMKEDGDLEDIEIEMDGNKKVVKKKMKKGDVRIIKSKGADKEMKMEKEIEVEVTADDDGEEKIYVIKIDDGDGEKVIEWKGDGEMPEEMKKYLKDGNMEIHMDEDHEGGEHRVTVFVGEEDEDMPKVTVRMGVELSPSESNVKVMNVMADSAAEKGGLKIGDIITEIDGFHIGSYKNLMERLSQHKVGDKISVRYIRDNKAATAEIELKGK